LSITCFLITGVFAPDSDDDGDGGRPGFGRKPKGGANYGTGIAFISAGIHKPAEKPKETEKGEQDAGEPKSSDSSRLVLYQSSVLP